MEQQIRDVLADHAHLVVDPASIDPEADLYEYGLTSHGTVAIMLELEDLFEVEFTDEMLRAETFRSVRTIGDALASLGAGAQA